MGRGSLGLVRMPKDVNRMREIRDGARCPERREPGPRDSPATTMHDCTYPYFQVSVNPAISERMSAERLKPLSGLKQQQAPCLFQALAGECLEG